MLWFLELKYKNKNKSNKLKKLMVKEESSSLISEFSF